MRNPSHLSPGWSTDSTAEQSWKNIQLEIRAGFTVDEEVYRRTRKTLAKYLCGRVGFQADETNSVRTSTKEPMWCKWLFR